MITNLTLRKGSICHLLIKRPFSLYFVLDVLLYHSNTPELTSLIYHSYICSLLFIILVNTISFSHPYVLSIILLYFYWLSSPYIPVFTLAFNSPAPAPLQHLFLSHSTIFLFTWFREISSSHQSIVTSSYYNSFVMLLLRSLIYSYTRKIFRNDRNGSVLCCYSALMEYKCFLKI